MSSNWPNYDGDDGDLKRQIEKERIREQIIAEEIARRRILEQEARRELMMEKEIASRSLQQPTSMSLGYSRPFFGHENSTCPPNFGGLLHESSRFRASEHLPFQRNPDTVAVAGSRFNETIVLTKPETTVCGKKHESPTPEADREGNDISSNKKLKGWNCVLCNVSATSEIDLKIHMQGRKHRAKVTQEKSYGTTAVVKKCNSSNEKPITVLVSTSDPGGDKAGKAGGESSGRVHDEAAEAGNQISAQNMNIISYPRSDNKASDVDLHNNGDTPKKEMPSAKPSEKSNFWCEMCKVAATCANDMAAHEAGKKHLAKLHKYISAKDMSMSSSTKPLYMENGAQGINGGDALLKETEKEITQNRLESTFIPFEMSKMLNANVVVSSRDNGSNVLCPLRATIQKGLSEHSLSTETSNTAMGSTCDPGVKISFKPDGKSSENVDCVAVVAEKKNSTAKLNYKTEPTSSLKAKDVGSNGNGDTSGPQTTPLSAKSWEKNKFWCEMCKVGVTSTEMMASHEGGKKHLAKLHNAASSYSESSATKILSMEKAVLAKGIEATEEEVTQSELESIVIPSEMEKVKTTIHDKSIGDGNFVLCPLSATSESGVDEHKSGENNKAMEAELVGLKTVNPSPEESIITFGIKKAIEDEHGRYVNSTEKGDAPGPQITKPSAKSCEKFKFWYQMSQVETCPAKVLCDDKLYEEPCALPDIAWFIEQVTEDVIDEDVFPKGAK